MDAILAVFPCGKLDKNIVELNSQNGTGDWVDLEPSKHYQPALDLF